MTSTLQERVREAGAAGTPLRIAGNSSWQSAGRPVAAAETISVADHSGVVDYVSSDLTITVRAGTMLAEIARVTGDQGQWLPLNPFGSAEGTIGATVATASSGPLAHGFGTIRDLVLGVEIVTGDAKIVRGGGRVVKNVAGFDLVRLLTGSWGTLGVITEVSLRLYALPAHRTTMAMDAPTDTRRLAQRLRSLLDASIIPFSLELVSEELARRIGLPARPTILVEFGGNAPVVSAQRDALTSIATATEVPTDVWEKMRATGVSDAMVVRVSGLPGGLAERWERARSIGRNGEPPMMHASIGRGTVRCIFPGELPASAIDGLAASHADDTMIFETLPAALWTSLAQSATADRVSQGIKRAFDPFGILNPGILGPTN
ncbi:MAG: FAD-binding protein [Gemmatimonadota bacterium]|nr:FAD-binding protein [Gemmatimonadota bacterium]